MTSELLKDGIYERTIVGEESGFLWVKYGNEKSKRPPMRACPRCTFTTKHIPVLTEFEDKLICTECGFTIRLRRKMNIRLLREIGSKKWHIESEEKAGMAITGKLFNRDDIEYSEHLVDEDDVCVRCLKRLHKDYDMEYGG